MKKLFGLAVVGLLIAASVVVPHPVQPVPESPDAPAASPFAVCPLGQAARRSTTLSFLSEPGDAAVSVFSAGEVVAESEVSIPVSGSARLELVDLTGLATAPVLIELPAALATVDTVLTGDGIAAAACRPGSAETVLFPGASTVEGESLSVVLANPFAGSASVDIAVASEVGAESDPALNSIVVPSRSALTVDISALLPGRQSMSIAVTTVEGRVVASTQQSGGGELAAWNGTTPATDSYLPIPVIPDTSVALALAAPGAAEVAFQLDVYGPDGIFEAAIEDVIPARGQILLPVGQLLEEGGPGAVRVVAAGPVSAALRFRGNGIRAVSQGIAEPRASWALPGAGILGRTNIHVLNTSDVEVTAEITTGEGSGLESVTFPAGVMTTVDLPASSSGYRVEADGDLVVNWTTLTDAGLAAEPGRPLGR